jgi:hypothetical protein
LTGSTIDPARGTDRGWRRLATRGESLGCLAAAAILMYAVFVPLAACFRFFRRDALQLRYDAPAATYWVKRQPQGGDLLLRPPRALLVDLRACFAASGKPWLAVIAVLMVILGAPLLLTRHRTERSEFLYPLY